MKKKYPVSNNAAAPVKFCKHLRKDGKRRVNQSTRRLHLIHTRQEHDEVMRAAGLGHAIEGDGQEHSEIMREIMGH